MNTTIEPDDSPSGAQMILTSIHADPADLAVFELFGDGDLVAGLHMAAQLVRAALITEGQRRESTPASSG